MRSLILLKPDCIGKKLCGKVITRFEGAGFRITAAKVIQLTPTILREHYAHIADKPFFPEIEKFMGSCPVIALVLDGENVIDRIREILGVTDCTQAAPGTIRAEFGSKDPKTCKMMNIAHASDSEEAAEREVERFFPEKTTYRNI